MGSSGVVSRGAFSLEAISIARDRSARVLPMALFSTVNAAVFLLSAIFFFLGETRVFLLKLRACGEVIDIYSGRTESIGVGGADSRAATVITTSIVGVVHGPDLVKFFSQFDKAGEGS